MARAADGAVRLTDPLSVAAGFRGLGFFGGLERRGTPNLLHPVY
jgi:hypothetical protein